MADLRCGFIVFEGGTIRKCHLRNYWQSNNEVTIDMNIYGYCLFGELRNVLHYSNDEEFHFTRVILNFISALLESFSFGHFERKLIKSIVVKMLKCVEINFRHSLKINEVVLLIKCKKFYFSWCDRSAMWPIWFIYFSYLFIRYF